MTPQDVAPEAGPAPTVVAVVVTCDPGPEFDETLRALAAQDYPSLAVLVLDAGSREDPTARVAAALPDAFVSLLGSNDGFPAAATRALTMVEGASHLLLCHDDVAPDPDVVHQLVEESYRSNAGIVAPKMVSWDDPRRLLHVGMGVDRSGAVVDRVEADEIDHGQHDAVRDVFLAPSGCLLVRTDLFAELGGYDTAIVAMGEDLDLCWRAQVAGARVVVAPAARVRHREALAGGARSLPPGAAGASLQELQRRHELRAVLKDYGPAHRARVVPQAAVLALAEVAIAWAGGQPERARAVTRAWRWNLARRTELRQARRQVAELRRRSDAEVRRLQLRGSARLTAYVRRAFTRGVAAVGPHAPAGGAARPGLPGSGLRRNGHGAGPAEDSAPGLGRRGVSPVQQPALRTTLWIVTAAVLLFGTRQLLFGPLPEVGQLVPLPAVGQAFHRFWSTWQPAGLGVTGDGSPGFALLGLAGSVLLGAVGTLQKLLVLGMVPLGALGMARFLAPFGSWRVRTVGALAYLAVPAPYDALATGHWDGLLAYGAAPWVVRGLGRVARLEPFDAGSRVGAVEPGTGGDTLARAPQVGASPAAGGPDSGVGGPSPTRWWAPWRSVVGLGLFEAALLALAPTLSVPVLCVGAGLALGCFVAGERRALAQGARVLAGTLTSTLVAAALLLPWSVGELSGPRRLSVLVGPPPVPATAATWGALVRLAPGPLGHTALAWAMPGAAAASLVLARRWRWAWAARLWSLALAAWLVAWAGGRGWLGPGAPSAAVLVPLAAAGVAGCVGLGVAAFESDLPSYRFGWRQVVVVLGAALAVVAAVPVLVGAGGGRWDLPPDGWGFATAWMGQQGTAGAGGFRVLWLGDPALLPGAGWPVSAGLSYEVARGGAPDLSDLWAGSDPGPAAAVAHDVDLVRTQSTARFGALLAPHAIRYVVVVESFAPAFSSYQSPLASTSTTTLLADLTAQVDLRQVPGQAGFVVYAVAGAAPLGRAPAGPGGPGHALELVGEIALWLAAVGLLVVRRRRPPPASPAARTRHSVVAEVASERGATDGAAAGGLVRAPGARDDVLGVGAGP